MKDEEIKKYLGKKVIITFKDGNKNVGVLSRGYTKLGNDWLGAGYHLRCIKKYDFGFKNSHIKKIEVIEDEKNN